MMKKTLLITRPFYENPTNYLYHWSKPLIDLASRKNFTVIDLEKEKVNRKELEGRLEKVNPELVVFNGHGSETVIFGQDRTAKLFLEPSNQVVISLIKGNSAVQSHRNGKKAYLRNIQRLLTSESSSEDTTAVRYLIWNMTHQVCLGNQSASLTL